MIVPGLRKRHVLILGLCAYTLQAIATAEGPFRLNHSLFFAVGENGKAGWTRSLGWLDKSADLIDKWSIERFGKDPWAQQGFDRYAQGCVTTPSIGKGYVSIERINLYQKAKKKDLTTLGTPLCKTLSGNLRYVTDNPSVLFEVNSTNLNQYGAVRQNP